MSAFIAALLLATGCLTTSRRSTSRHLPLSGNGQMAALLQLGKRLPPLPPRRRSRSGQGYLVGDYGLDMRPRSALNGPRDEPLEYYGSYERSWVFGAGRGRRPAPSATPDKSPAYAIFVHVTIRSRS